MKAEYVRILRRVQKHILEEPRRFFMSGIVMKAKNQKQWSQRAIYYLDVSHDMPPCGTAACIGGWINILTGHPKRSLKGAAKAIGLKLSDHHWERTLADQLFFASRWPEPFHTQWMKAQTPRKRARIAYNRIEYLIKKGE